MVKVTFNDGTTLGFDLNNGDDRKQWEEWSMVEDFQSKITSVGIIYNKKFITVPFPRRFRRVRFYAELVWQEKNGKKRLLGERVICHADEVKTSLLVYTYNNPPPPVLSRIDVERVGKQMFPGIVKRG